MAVCPKCKHEYHETHYNSPSMLPPVALPFVIVVEGKEHVVIRESYAEKADSNLLYLGANKRVFLGRYRWRHK